MTSAFEGALRTCLTEPGTFPEDLLEQMVSRSRLMVTKLFAIRYLTYSKYYAHRDRKGKYKAAAKTFLYPGSVWHTHNYTQVDVYLKNEESNASAVTPTIPSAAELALPPFNDTHTGYPTHG